ncbi:MAG: alpha/beta hydrolase-fold protein [bacterium]
MDTARYTIREGAFTGSKVKPGTVHRYTLYVPSKASPAQPAALYVQQDGMLAFVPELFERLSADGTMPVCAALGVASGSFPATREGGFARSTRSPEYDGLGPGYANFLIEELIPFVRKEYGLNLSDDPDLHLIAGCSSGGISSWNAAWERNDFFRRVYMNSPTFSAFRGGDSLTVLMRKYETKPIRAYMTVGTDDMRNSAGDWYLEAKSASEALKYSLYDFAFEVFQNGPHGAGFGDAAVFEKAMRFIWKDWQTEVIRPLGLSPRVADIVTLSEPWRETSEPMPKACVPTIPEGYYNFDKRGDIWLNHADGTRTIAAETNREITSIAISCDRWRLYIADRNRRFVYAMAIQKDGALTDCYAHAHLHLADDSIALGAAAVCVDTLGRLYAGTQMGIQIASHTGQNNAILPLPGHLPVTGLAFSGEGNAMLYAESNGKVFKRKVLTSGLTETTTLMAPMSPAF